MTRQETGLERELFICDCGDVSHQFIVSIDLDPDWQHVSVEVKLNRNLPWWKRLCVALRYLFLLTPSRFGDYDEVLLSKEHAEPLQWVVDALKKLDE